MNDYTKDFIKKVFIIIIVPFIFLGILKIVYLLPGTEVGEVSDWIGFGGTYLGAIIAVGAIVYQIESTEKNRVFLEEKQLKETYKFLKFYLNNMKRDFYLVKSNLTTILNPSNNSSIDIKKLFSEGNIIIDPKLDDYFLEQIKKVSGEKIGTKLIELYIRTQNLEEVLKKFGNEKFLKNKYLKDERKSFHKYRENYNRIVSGLDNYIKNFGYEKKFLGYELNLSQEIKNLVIKIKNLVIENKKINIEEIEEYIKKIDNFLFKEEYQTSFNDIIFPEKNKDKVSLMDMVQAINIYSEIDKIKDGRIKDQFLQLYYLYIPKDLLKEDEQVIPNFQIYEEFIENIIEQINNKINEINKKYRLK